MPELTQDNTEQFISQFYTFFDSCIDRVDIVYGVPKSVQVEISTRDSTQDDKRVKVLLHIADVQEFLFQETKKIGYDAIRHGIFIGIFDGVVFIDFAPCHPDGPIKIGDYRRSHQYIAGKSCSWEIREDKEGNKE